MTIRFTKSWNGYYEGQIVTNPAGGNTEAQLIALGYAVSDLDGPDNSLQLAKFATDSSGNVTGLVGPGGVDALSNMGVDRWASKGGGTVMVDWANVTIGTPTAGWTVAKSTSKTFAGFQSLVITATAGAADTMTCDITIPATFLGGVKRLCYAICPGDDYISGDSSNAVQLWFAYSVSTTQRLQMFTNLSQAIGDWCESGAVYDQALTGSGHITGTTQWAKVAAEETTSVKLVMTKRAGQAISLPLYVGPVYTDPVRTQEAVMTIFMDGNYSGQYKYARQILQAYNLRASLATAFQTIGVSGMSEAEILKMYSLGHELICHTGTVGNVGWNDTGKYPDGQEYALVKADIKAAFDWMDSRSANRGKGYAVVGYTNGLVNTQTLTRRTNISNAIRDAGVIKCRQLGTYYGSYYGCAGEAQTLITQSRMASSADSTATLTGIVDSIIQQGGWSGLTFHDFVLSGATGNNLTATDFETVMEYIATKVAAGVLRVMPFSEAMQAISATPKPQ